jgi:predicted Zn-dependent protease
VEALLTGASDWQPATNSLPLRVGDKLRTAKQSRVAIRFSDLSVMRINELTTFEILPPPSQNKKPLLDLKSGSLYFFSREKPHDVQFRTPTIAGAVRGTEFHLQVAPSGETTLAMLEGEVALDNEFGQVALQSGEQAVVRPGQAPAKTALIDAVQVIQWCLYYPAIVVPEEVGFSPAEVELLRDSVAAYRSGDLRHALAAYPTNGAPAGPAASLYEAALRLSVGQVEQANQLLESLAAASPLAQALKQMIATVQGKSRARGHPPALATEWLAESYDRQAQGRLGEALQAARAATDQAPSSGFAWVRVAELEFSFGRLPQTRAALDRGLREAPRHAQGLALRGFVAAGQDRITEALDWFERAIAADGALGNAWLGRGLCRIRRGEREAGRQDLQTAAALEPRRALLRSYLGKAFAHEGARSLAEKELGLAKKLDPNDPTAWLYSALLDQQGNRINEAVRDLEQSKALNDNQRVFRSQLLLDQDRAVRAANLAAIYRDAGMEDVSRREATRAVDQDYANYSAHLFLSESYALLRDPKGFNLRYETPEKSEWLVANLLAPVGASTLSRNIAQQDYVRLFDQDGAGLSSKTEYFSHGEWVQTASQYGRLGRVGYALDGYYRSDPGHRPNNDLEHLQLSAQIKAQVTRQDSVFFHVEGFNQKSGDVQQYYDQASANPGLRVTEKQEPNALIGYHREWRPGLHTLFVAGRLDDTLKIENPLVRPLFLYYRNGEITRVPPVVRPFDLAYRSELETYSTELQQIWQSSSHTVIAGARYQTGGADASLHLFDPLQADIVQDLHTDFERVSGYGYYQWQILQPLRLTAGLSYDWMEFPENIDTSPISDRETTKDQLSPKVGLVFTPWKNTALRFAYTRSLGGLFNENSFRIEPSQVAGFNQTFRSLLPESAVGLAPGAEFDSLTAAIDQSFDTGTYLGVEAELLRSDAARALGTLTNSTVLRIADSPSITKQALDFEEKSLLLTANQLLSREWALGARYRVSEADLRVRYPGVPTTATGADALKRDETALLHQFSLHASFNHRCGFFSQFLTQWTAQSNDGYLPELDGDNFWQHHFFVGYRFPKRKAEIRLGLLNLTDRDYQLNPLTLHTELPRERTFMASFKLNF